MPVYAFLTNYVNEASDFIERLGNVALKFFLLFAVSK